MIKSRCSWSNSPILSKRLCANVAASALATLHTAGTYSRCKFSLTWGDNHPFAPGKAQLASVLQCEPAPVTSLAQIWADPHCWITPGKGDRIRHTLAISPPPLPDQPIPTLPLSTPPHSHPPFLPLPRAELTLSHGHYTLRQPFLLPSFFLKVHCCNVLYDTSVTACTSRTYTPCANQE